MAVTASALRQNIYQMLDRVLETGVPLEVTRAKGKVRIVPIKKPSKLDNLKKHNILNCDPEEIVHMDWSKEWRP
jgi:prevent-host-death family protein